MEGLIVKKMRLSKFTIIGLSILLVTSVITIYAFAFQDDWVVVCTKSATVKGGELIVVTFDMPPGPMDAVMFEFRISEGTIKQLAVWSTAFDSDLSKFQQFMDDMNAQGAPCIHEIGNETIETGFGGDNYDGETYSDQKWDIFLLNEDSYDKEVQIKISKR